MTIYIRGTRLLACVLHVVSSFACVSKGHEAKRRIKSCPQMVVLGFTA